MVYLKSIDMNVRSPIKSEEVKKIVEEINKKFFGKIDGFMAEMSKLEEDILSFETAIQYSFSTYTPKERKEIQSIIETKISDWKFFTHDVVPNLKARNVLKRLFGK